MSNCQMKNSGNYEDSEKQPRADPHDETSESEHKTM